MAGEGLQDGRIWKKGHQIKQTTKLAWAMIIRYDMSHDFDKVAMETVANQNLGGDTSLAYSDDRAKLDELAAYLYEHETITGDEFMGILNR